MAKVTGAVVPDALLVGVVQYDIESVEGLTIGEGDEQRELLGHIIFDKATIRLEQNMPNQMKAITLVHEAIHAIFEQTGHEHDEELIIGLGYSLAQIIVDNPSLIKFVQEACA